MGALISSVADDFGSVSSAVYFSEAGESSGALFLTRQLSVG